MTKFSFIAFDQEGRKVDGSIDGNSEGDALTKLASRGLTPTELTRGIKVQQKWWQREVNLGSKQDLRGLLKTLSVLSVLLTSGMPFVTALSFAKEQSSSPHLRKALQRIEEDVAAGNAVEDAVSLHSSVIGSETVALLKVGSRANCLPHAVAQAATLLEARLKLRQQVRSALAYPLVLSVMSLSIVVLLIAYLVPTLLPVFEAAQVAPPAVLATLDGLRTWFVDYPNLVLAILGSFAGLGYLIRTSIAETFLIGWNSIPFFGSLARKRASLAFLRVMQALLAAQATVPYALQTGSETTSNAVWKAQIEKALTQVEAGGSIPIALREIGFLDERTLKFLETGHETGDINIMIGTSIALLEQEVTSMMSSALSFLTPVLTLVIGGLIGTLIVTTISAILDLNATAL